MKHKGKTFILLMLIQIAALFCAVSAGCGEDVFSVRRIGNIHSYADNAFQIRAAESGFLEIRIHDSICVYRKLSQHIQPGETVIHWDGCGYNREKLYEKTYTVTAELTTDSGTVHSISFDSPVEYPVQCLQYALPSSPVIYLDDPESWFIEYRTVAKGKVMVELTSAKDPEEKYIYSADAAGGKIARRTFPELYRKKLVPPSGEYTLSVYELSKPDEKYESLLTIEETTPDPEPVTVTGEIMPDRNMSDAQIWELMRKPSVVVDIDSFRHQEVYAEPDSSSTKLGTLHGQTQGLKVLSIEGGWALIGAWNHEEASYIEGWVPAERLKVEAPRGEYGLLIDKQKQTLAVYRNGELIDTLLVSTGRAEKNSLYQETSAGCFLTGYHRVNFSMNGKKYDYVIQYDGGNLLHQTPYDWGQQKKDFTLGRGYLGAKASHACIRIQPEPGEGGLNAYWLFTHLPYHTRVIILDDPWEHESVNRKLKRSDRDTADLSAIHLSGFPDDATEKQVVITFGGCVVPGGIRSFNNRDESFSSFIRTNGYDMPLSGLKSILAEDDLTCVTLQCSIQKDRQLFPSGKGSLYAAEGTEKIFENSSIELVQMYGDSFLSAGQPFCDDTAEVLQPYTDVLRSGEYLICTLKGHTFGFAGCTESEYLKDPGVIDRKMAELKSAGCEKTVMLLNWSDGNETSHTIVQEAMAHRSVRAGADLVAGNRQGIVQGLDLIEGVPVIYSTGDLLNGSTSKKPRTQQGILVRAVFSFESEQSQVSLTVIPIMPYGKADTKANEYIPVHGLPADQFEKIINVIWNDSTDAALDRFLFCND